MRITMKITYTPADDSSSDESGSISEDLTYLEQEIAKFEPVLDEIQEKLVRIENDMRAVHGFYPATEAVKAWCDRENLIGPFTLEDWVKIVLQKAVKKDLDTRMLTFEDGAPWGTNLSLFDLLRGTNVWFIYR
jgi:hypothetical protein